MANQLKPILDGAKISLEKAASDKFGAAVEEFARGTLGPALGVQEPDPNGTSRRDDGAFYMSSYAAALAGGTSYRPKLKFLFKVEFVFTEAAKQAFPEVLGGKSSNDFTFMVKSVDRPKIDFEYEDDINMYNFRTKVLKKIRHRELTMTFMDDTGNRVLNFFRALMMIHSPITRRQLLREGLADYQARIAPPDGYAAGIGNGMEFSQPTEPGLDDTAIRGAVNSPVGNVIQSIRIKQMYVNSGVAIGQAVEETIFDFMNARLVSFDLDELTHEGSDANLITMQFDYDWMEIIQVGPLMETDGPIYNITVPGITGAPIDISPVGGDIANPQGGAGGVFGNIIANSIGRAGQTITSTAINRAVKSVAGNGRFASLLGSQASNILGGVVGAASRNISTSVVNQAGAAFSNLNVIKAPGEALASIGSSLSSGIRSVVGSSSVLDSTIGGRAPTQAVVTSHTPFGTDEGE